jgi:hypothetical protein
MRAHEISFLSTVTKSLFLLLTHRYLSFSLHSFEFAELSVLYIEFYREEFFL